MAANGDARGIRNEWRTAGSIVAGPVGCKLDALHLEGGVGVAAIDQSVWWAGGHDEISVGGDFRQEGAVHAAVLVADAILPCEDG